MRHTPHDPLRAAQRLRRVAAATATGALLAAAAFAGPDGEMLGSRTTPEVTRSTGTLDARDLVTVAKKSHRWKGHPGRRIKHYTVHKGDTATGLAVRFHAWTDELMALNHLSSGSTLYVGQRLRIPVVVAAARKARTHHKKHHAAKHHHHKKHHAKKHHRRHHRTRHQTHALHKARHHRHGWVHADASRATVRRVVIRSAQRHRVSPNLALAVAWQESGWQQRRVSSAGALGVMQVMPATGRWLSLELGHDLHLRDLHDNVAAGVVLLKYLRSQAGPRHTIGGYYQGLGSVRSHGLYPSTKHYVRSVVAIRKDLRHGWNPAR